MGRFPTSFDVSSRYVERLVGLGGFAILAFVMVSCGGGEQTDPDSSWTVDEPDVGSTDTVGDDTSRDTRVDTSTSPNKVTGRACDSRSECIGDVCMPEKAFPDGYCTTIDCDRGECAGDNAVCVEFRRGSTGCLAGCSSHDDCRQGYSCQSTDGGRVTACLPGPPPPPMTFDETREVLDVACNPRSDGLESEGTRYLFDFSIANDANGFLMVPYVTKGTVRPVSLQTPRASVDIRNDYRHHNARLSETRRSEDLTGVGTFGDVALDWPILVPYAPQYSDYVVPGGDYTVEVLADEEEPCIYVLENRPGKTLDLNFYFVGANGRDADSAPTDSDLAEAVDELERVYRKVGIEIGKIRYRDVPDEIVSKYRRVTSHEDAFRLTAQGQPPTGALAGHLSVDVFLVDSVDVDRGGSGNVLGLSAGIPGAAGLHGHARNGLVFQTLDLGEDNEHVGLIMAHEIGHYLGLRHTTEVVHGTDQGEQVEDLLGTTDPIEDTAICEDIYETARRDPGECDDYGNLMFPLAPRPSQNVDPRITDGQGKAMTWNPLID